MLLADVSDLTPSQPNLDTAGVKQDNSHQFVWNGI